MDHLIKFYDFFYNFFIYLNEKIKHFKVTLNPSCSGNKFLSTNEAKKVTNFLLKGAWLFSILVPLNPIISISFQADIYILLMWLDTYDIKLNPGP